MLHSILFSVLAMVVFHHPNSAVVVMATPLVANDDTKDYCNSNTDCDASTFCGGKEDAQTFFCIDKPTALTDPESVYAYSDCVNEGGNSFCELAGSDGGYYCDSTTRRCNREKANIFACASDDECRDGLVCNTYTGTCDDRGTGGGWLNNCFSDSHCDGTQECANGACRRAFGSSCGGDYACASNKCVKPGPGNGWCGEQGSYALKLTLHNFRIHESGCDDGWWCYVGCKCDFKARIKVIWNSGKSNSVWDQTEVVWDLSRQPDTDNPVWDGPWETTFRKPKDKPIDNVYIIIEWWEQDRKTDGWKNSGNEVIDALLLDTPNKLSGSGVVGQFNGAVSYSFTALY